MEFLDSAEYKSGPSIPATAANLPINILKQCTNWIICHCIRRYHGRQEKEHRVRVR